MIRNCPVDDNTGNPPAVASPIPGVVNIKLNVVKKKNTATMLPTFLHYLKTHNYRVVHLVPARAAGESEIGPR